jgi:hypothetical protein
LTGYRGAVATFAVLGIGRTLGDPRDTVGTTFRCRVRAAAAGAGSAGALAAACGGCAGR